MDISPYQADALLGQREKSRIVERPPVTEISGIGGQGSQSGEEDGNIFFDTLVDTVNPLQHIPGVSSVYQAATGDETNPIASMAGGFLFGGPIGLAAGAASSFFEMITGDSVMGHVASLFGEEEVPQPEGGLTELASKADPGALESLIRPTGSPLSLENYQAFAQAQAQQNIGTGAQSQDVNWTSNIWTSHALKDATGIYETNQQLGEHQKRMDDAIV
ncbi:hypothetical protein V5T82_00525 [Magnetovibrio sp. PR-2]|uniref:hypothetical protein n=1 Tax=Magnetovibrio sp. PR-2 TaxID=3120356 RepID=UPI002FCE01EA